jgi:hypothetical protein
MRSPPTKMGRWSSSTDHSPPCGSGEHIEKEGAATPFFAFLGPFGGLFYVSVTAFLRYFINLGESSTTFHAVLACYPAGGHEIVRVNDMWLVLLSLPRREMVQKGGPNGP